MITIHDATATSFEATGLGVLDLEIINPEVCEELNQSFTLSFDYPATGTYAEHMKLENIVACSVPYIQARQAFRISAVEVDLKGILHVEAAHLFFDLAGSVIADYYMPNCDAGLALNTLLDAGPPYGFDAVSADTTTRATMHPVAVSQAEAIMGGEGSFLDVFGGELEFDNYHVRHTLRRGVDSGVVIQDRKNLTGYKSSVDLSTVATALFTVASGGVQGPMVYSPNETPWNLPHTRVLKLNDIKIGKDPTNLREGELTIDQAYQQMKQLGLAEFDKGIDQPKASYKISFVNLAATKEYADYQALETVQLGDRVTVRHQDLGVDLTARVVAYTWDPLNREYLNLELGSATPKLADMTSEIRRVEVKATEAKEQAGVALTSADGKNTNYYTEHQPLRPKIGDVWFKREGEKTGIWVYAMSEYGYPTWVPLSTDITQAELQLELDQARAEVEEAKTATQAAIDATASIDTKLAAVRSELATAVTAAQSAASAVASEVDGKIAALEGQYVPTGEVIARINITPETIQIDGARVHITGQTLIDAGVIKTAMIADAAITNAKIGNLDAGKITTGFLDAALIRAGSITSEKLSIAEGFITTAMIADAAITNAKIGNLDAGKINTGVLAAARIAAGSITSDKLKIANGFIKTAMIADAAITSAKIVSIDAAKITTGYLNSARIAAGSITADKLAANAIQVGLAGWNQTLRITPTQLSWYSGSTLIGRLSAYGIEFWNGSTQVGRFDTGYSTDGTRGIGMVIPPGGQYMSWCYESYSGTLTGMMWLRPSGLLMGVDILLNGRAIRSPANRGVSVIDATIGSSTMAGLQSNTSGNSAVGFGSTDLMVVTNGRYYNMTRIAERVGDLIGRVNALIGMLNYGWVVNVQNGQVTSKYNSTGLSAMSTTLA